MLNHLQTSGILKHVQFRSKVTDARFESSIIPVRYCCWTHHFKILSSFTFQLKLMRRYAEQKFTVEKGCVCIRWLPFPLHDCVWLPYCTKEHNFIVKHLLRMRCIGVRADLCGWFICLISCHKMTLLFQLSVDSIVSTSDDLQQMTSSIEETLLDDVPEVEITAL